jgi:ferredoxin
MAASPGWELVVDPIQCQAHGLCAALLPEVVDLDEWGYPMFAGPVPPPLLREARAAVFACPSLALRLARRS